MNRLKWTKLLSTKRISEFENCNISVEKSNFNDPRSCFERDFDQIIFSYPFRRLQDKTQVIPFPKFDFVHTRLTHSLEVASVGRSFGKLAADKILSELKNEEDYDINKHNFSKSDIGSLIAAACLAHDIGNPPFGHSGEDSISNYFINNNDSTKLGLNYKIENQSKINYNFEQQEWDNVNTNNVTPYEILEFKKYSDLIDFEGNANGFRILTTNCDKGINPTCALLGTFSKYPKESYLFKNPFANLDKKSIPKSQSKYGFFQNERDTFRNVANELGLIETNDISSYDISYKRHPLAFLMEASDDIAYGMIDFEDGCRLNLIDFDKEYGDIKVRKNDNSFKNYIIRDSPKNILIKIAKRDSSFSEEKLNSLNDTKQKVAYLRAKVINVLIHLTYNVFEKNYEDIMCGKFDKSLVECLDKEITDNLELMEGLIRKFVYHYPPVLECEASGFKVVNNLIESLAMTSNICFVCGDETTSEALKLKQLLPKEYQPNEDNSGSKLTYNEKYKRILIILDYISGMTDKFALNLYRKINGIEN
jgi:dGTPase